jgi:hypothetical protein
MNPIVILLVPIVLICMIVMIGQSLSIIFNWNTTDEALDNNTDNNTKNH